MDPLIHVRLTIFTDAPSSPGTVHNADVVVGINKGSTLYEALVKAKDDNRLKFESKCFTFGKFITSMQGVKAGEDEYWALINGATRELLQKGVSSYIPTNNEQIVFRLKMDPLISVRLTIFINAPSSPGIVPNANVVVSVPEGSTLYEALVRGRNASLIIFKSKISNIGPFITSMQDVTADKDAHEYWALINGKTGELLPKGVSSYIPTNNEQIVFRLKMDPLIHVRLTILINTLSSRCTVLHVNVVVSVYDGSTLYEALVKGRNARQIRFESKPFPKEQYITSMEGVKADAHEYWALINGATEEFLPKGVSSYFPTNNEEIVFRLKKW